MTTTTGFADDDGTDDDSGVPSGTPLTMTSEEFAVGLKEPR